MPYVSVFDFMFKEDRHHLMSGDYSPRSTFLSYPKHLKMTLFFDEPRLVKVRQFEFLQRYLVVDELREHANKYYYSAEYEKAILAYVQVRGDKAGIFRA